MKVALIVFTFLFLSVFGSQVFAKDALPVIRVGSKNFTEGYLLSELIAQQIERSGLARVERKFGLGGTGIIAEALANASIDLYPEYTGTISEVLLKDKTRHDIESLRRALLPQNLIISESLGFNNTYALAARADYVKKNSVHKISDLKSVVGSLRLGFTYEFMSRGDGYEAMRKAYDLQIDPQQVRRMEHALIYTAIANGEIDIAEVYSTDAKVETLGLVLLEDDLQFFPPYEAVILARSEFATKHPEVWNELRSKLENRLGVRLMQTMNAKVDLDKISFANVIKQEFGHELAEQPSSAFAEMVERVARRTKEHLALVGISLFFSLLIGLPLGILASAFPKVGQGILAISGVVQTIPSLALLAFLIPFFGIGPVPALIALFLYGLLPIVLNTHTGLQSLDPSYKEMSFVLGLNWRQRLRNVDLPLVSPQILAGIKTSAIIGIGTATLAALIGAGGLGAPIITGLALNDQRMILTGAAPAAGLALLVHFLFEFLQRWLFPKGLRLPEFDR